jgi:hypothetical protein
MARLLPPLISRLARNIQISNESAGPQAVP